MAKGDVTRSLDEIGIDEIARMILEGKSMREISVVLKCSQGMLTGWIGANPERSARAREARSATAQMWEERAEAVIELAGDQFELAKAKELAHHYRWRAAKINPREYGDVSKQVISGPNGGPIQHEHKFAEEMTDAELADIIATSGIGTSRT